jgi:CubicO group peptidase (beta-lactamase class C family)
MTRMGACAAALACVFLCGGAAPAPERATPEAWIRAFNAQDKAALKALGDENDTYDRDKFEETGGLDFVKVDKDDGKNIEALARERLSGGMMRRLVLTRDDKNPARFSDIRLRGEPLESEDAALAALHAFADRLVKKDEFSGVLLVRRDGQDLVAKAYGYADAGEHVPNTMDTRFFMASQGKMFTAVSIFQLIEKGRVSLDDMVGKFLPHYPNRDIATKVSVRMLLSHSGGTGEMGLLEPGDAANRAKVHSIAAIIALNGVRGPAFPPGTKFDYSNYGYVLLGAIVEKASGMDYYAYVQKNILDSAGMTHTGFPLHDDMAGIAVPMTMKNGKLVSAMDQWPWRGTPAGGGVSTANDEAKFVAALNSNKLISKASLAFATHAPGGLGFKEGNGFGYGFIESGVNGLNYWGHAGGADGDSTVLNYTQKIRMTFVCLANRDPEVCDRLAANLHYHWPRK